MLDDVDGLSASINIEITAITASLLDLNNNLIGLSQSVNNELDYINATFSNYYLASNPAGYITASSLIGVEYKVNKDQPNGYAGLDGNGYIPTNILPDSVVGNVKYKGTYNGVIIVSSPQTNLIGQPLPIAATANMGWFLISLNSFTYSGIDFNLGDWAFFSGLLSKGFNAEDKDFATMGDFFKSLTPAH
jgi:hypothetical protein